MHADPPDLMATECVLWRRYRTGLEMGNPHMGLSRAGLTESMALSGIGITRKCAVKRLKSVIVF